MIFLLAFLFLASCGTEISKQAQESPVAQEQPKSKQECDFPQLEQKFLAEARAHKIEIESTRTKYYVVPRSWFQNSQGCRSPRAIACGSPGNLWILDSYWNSANCTMREQTFFHELGHGLLDKRHTDPLAVMQPFAMASKTWEANRTELLASFFAGAEVHEGQEFWVDESAEEEESP